MALRTRLSLAFVLIVLIPILVGAIAVLIAVPHVLKSQIGTRLRTAVVSVTDVLSARCTQTQQAAQLLGFEVATRGPQAAVTQLVSDHTVDYAVVSGSGGATVASAGKLAGAPAQVGTSTLNSCADAKNANVAISSRAGLAIAARAVFGAVVDPTSGYETLGGVIGTSMAATFLYLIAALNLVVLAGILKVFRGMRQGLYDEEELERQLQARGLMYRFFGRFMRSITKTWHMFFVGIVFGIGFDTATEVLLLAATAAAATQGLPWYAVVSLPLLFAGGMTLFDTIDGCFMNFAYGWAFAKPVRKVYYNLVITGLSIAVAFLIGTIEIVGLLSAELHIHGGLWDLVAGFDINRAGFAIAGLFVVVWAVAIAYWRLGKLDRRWAPATAGEAPGPEPASDQASR